MSAYWDILSAVQAKIQTLQGVNPGSVKIRSKAMVSKDADTLPLILVCPRKDSWEEFADIQFSNNAHVDYPVLVGVIVDSTFDHAGLRFLLDVRDQIRRALFKPDALSNRISTVFDVRYNPAPRGADTSALASNLDPSFQEFTYRNDETRAT
jgi:hypothetical protein